MLMNNFNNSKYVLQNHNILFAPTQAPSFWNPTKNIMFVREYLRHDVLWNPRHPHHRMSTAREHAFDTIGRVFGKPVMGRRMVGNRIKYMRGRYTKERRDQAAGNGTSAGRSDWYVEMDSFLSRFQKAIVPAPAAPAMQPSASDNDMPAAVATSTYAATADSAATATADSVASATTILDRIERHLRIVQRQQQNLQQTMQELHSLAVEEAIDRARGAQSEIGGVGNHHKAFGNHVSSSLGTLHVGEARNCEASIADVLQQYLLRKQQMSALNFLMQMKAPAPPIIVDMTADSTDTEE